MKRTGLQSAASSAVSEAKAERQKGVLPAKIAKASSPTQTTAIVLPKEDIALLRKVAGVRAAANDSRASVSDVVRDLIDKSRKALEAEAK